jgi:VWFA-related protein
LLIGSLYAQTPAPAAPGAQPPVPLLKQNVRAVVVDVVVTKSDQPISGLHQQDFQVVEDGKPQTIDFFEEHTAKTLPPGSLAPLPQMPPNVYTNVPPAPESDAVNVLLLDSLNTEKQDQAYVHKQILNFLKTMQPGTRCAIFILGSRLRFVQGFTTDTSVLTAALNNKKAGFSPEKDPSSRSLQDNQDEKDQLATMTMMSNGLTAGVEAVGKAQADFAVFQFAQRASMTMEALQYLARYLGGVPGRKNLIWFASEFPVNVFPSPAQKQELNYARVYASDVKKTADLLTISRVALYPIGAEGMMNDHWMEAGNTGPVSAGAGTTNPGRASGGAEIARDRLEENSARADNIIAMERLANDTGGKAFYNTNDLNAATMHAIGDGSHYYTLVYTPTNKKMDGQYRRIEIKLNQGNYKLAYRRGYNADNPTAGEAKPETDPLRPLLLHGLPDATQLLYGVRVVPVSPQPEPNATRAGKNPNLTGPVTRYSVDFMIRWTDVQLEASPQETHSGKIQLGLLAYDRNGNAVNWIGGTQMMNLKPDNYAAIQKSGIPAHMEIDLPNTEVYLVTGVYDWSTGKAGTLEIPIHPAAQSATAGQHPAAQPN